ncbi:hypothetical protein [Draconibacterium sediminis]|uniref:hypothetical protein n=1 Tax=Draconibacterium sediminis TaxID=1544798 RepID=UPI0026EF2D13|nr:hypothetical protein [Draconibacterium sediminis]
MNEFLISLNQFADFTKATERGKARIVEQQLNPNPFKIIWYQLTKARIKKSIQHQGDLTPIYEALEILKNRTPTNPRQVSDKRISVEALNKFVKMKLPKVFRKNPYSIVTPPVKTTRVGDVIIRVAPDVVVKFEVDGKVFLGAIKIHVSKNKPFDYSQSLMISTILYKYLNEIKKEDEFVDPNLCFSLDIFGDRIVSAPANIDVALSEVERNCEEIKAIWGDIV